jgi:hypothetical protein
VYIKFFFFFSSSSGIRRARDFLVSLAVASHHVFLLTFKAFLLSSLFSLSLGHSIQVSRYFISPFVWLFGSSTHPFVFDVTLWSLNHTDLPICPVQKSLYSPIDFVILITEQYSDVRVKVKLSLCFF